MSEKKKKPVRPKTFNVLTFSTPCPSCGGTVEFASAGSVLSVCEYCQTSVVREGEDVKAQGKQSLVIEDYSPLQLGSSGIYGKHVFVLVGRVQLEYSDGIWNEWYIHFDNGKTGWLSEALGQYSLTLEKGEQPDLPSYDMLYVRDKVNFGDDVYTVSDKRTANAIAGEGELPFVVGKGWQTWVIDARCKRKFITLDYQQEESGVPSVFEGVAVALEKLNMQFLKDDGQMASGSNLSGGGDSGNPTEVGKIDCPNCGGAVPNVVGVTSCLICPSCHAEIALEGDKADVVAVHAMMQTFPTSLSLGDKARVNDSDLAYVNEYDEQSGPTSWENNTHDYVVIGIQRMREVGEIAQWTEYLLYSFTDGFLWMAEEPQGWFMSRVLNEMPESDRGSLGLTYQGKKWRPQFDESYQSQVRSAIGAFNWKVNVSDVMTLTDYKNGNQSITAEENASEITYTISTPIDVDQISEWFGKEIKAMPNYSSNRISGDDNDSFSFLEIVFIVIIVIVVIALNNSSYIGSTSHYSTGDGGDRSGYSTSGSHK